MAELLVDNQHDDELRKNFLLDSRNPYRDDELLQRIQHNEEIIKDTEKYLAYLQKFIEDYERLHN